MSKAAVASVEPISSFDHRSAFTIHVEVQLTYPDVAPVTGKKASLRDVLRLNDLLGVDGPGNGREEGPLCRNLLVLLRGQR